MDEIDWQLQDRQLHRITKISTMLEDSVRLALQSVSELESVLISMRITTSRNLSPVSYNLQEETRLEGAS